jgi:hypothetical protein
VPAEPLPASPSPVAFPDTPVAAAAVSTVSPTAPEHVTAPPPLPTLEDVARLTQDSDFSRFVRPGVDDTVKRAAMKKLFSDPHFNVMDGLDTYIDDYGIPDPIPDEMLRRMTQSKFLRLFDDEPPADGTATAASPQASPDGAAAPALPQSDAPAAEAPIDEDPALRLQPDDAAGPAGAGPHRPDPRP